MSIALALGGVRAVAQDDTPRASKRGVVDDEPAAQVERKLPKLKTPEAETRLKKALESFDAEKYTDARTVLGGLLKDATGPDDKKIIQALIDDTKLGTELETAKGQASKKDERKAITRVEKAIKLNPTSTLRPKAERFIRDTEELIYLILDDFEPGDVLETVTKSRQSDADDAPAKGGTSEEASGGPPSGAYRVRKNMVFNSDPKLVKHGKGSMKWKVGGDWGYSYRYWWNGYGYSSPQLKNSITKWKQLVFWVYLPESDEGALRVTLSPDSEQGVFASLYSKKFVDLRGKKGWFEARLDLRNDFGNTQNVPLDEVRWVRIENMHLKVRTLYLDFVHFE